MTLNSVSSTQMAPAYSGGDSVSTTPAHTAPAPAQSQAPASAPSRLPGSSARTAEPNRLPGSNMHAAESGRLPGSHADFSHLPGSQPADDAELEKIMEEPIKQANKALEPFHRSIEREIHSVTKALMYTIRDTETKEVIAEYPPKKIQDMIAKMWELAGLFIDQKA